MGGAEEFLQPQRHPEPQSQPAPAPAETPAPVPTADPGTADGLLRVSIIGPFFLFGEFERFIRNLMAYVDRTKVKWETVCSLAPEFYFPHQEVADVGAEPMGGNPGAQLAAQRCDLAIVWGGVPTPDPNGEARVLTLAREMLEPTVDPTKLVASRSREEMRQGFRVAPNQRAIAFMDDHVTRNNPWALTQALKVLNDARGEGDPEYVGIFIGEGHDLPDLRQYEQRIFGPDAPTRYLGGRTDLGNILAGVDVLLAPVLGATSGQSVVEAMAAGVPVVATPLGVAASPKAADALILVPRAIENLDGPIPPMQLEQPELAERIGTAYAEAISEVFSNREATAARVERARELVLEEYSPGAFAQRWTAELLRAGDWS